MKLTWSQTREASPGHVFHIQKMDLECLSLDLEIANMSRPEMVKTEIFNPLHFLDGLWEVWTLGASPPPTHSFK